MIYFIILKIIIFLVFSPGGGIFKKNIREKIFFNICLDFFFLKKNEKKNISEKLLFF